MDEGAHTQEGVAERIPTKEEVLAVIGRFAENATLVREMSDEKGLYLLIARVEGPGPNEATQYEYMRKGTYPNNNVTPETAIHRVYYETNKDTGEEEAVSAHKVADYDSERGEWKEVK